MTHQIILGSQSEPRKQLLNKLKIDFKIIPAHIDETQKSNEQPMDLVERLSKEKNLAVIKKLSSENPNLINHKKYLIITSDQVAVHDNKIYGKPGNYQAAKDQLELFNNKTIEFITGLYITEVIYNPDNNQNNNQINYQITKEIYTKEISTIKIKPLDKQQISNYLNKEEPYQSAASFKIEGLGIALVEKITTDDFNAIIGLPLIKLTNILQDFGVKII